jgi:hypothetical protein
MANGPKDYVGNTRQGHGTSFPGVRVGNVPDPNYDATTDSTNKPTGVPLFPVCRLFLTAPAASDVDALLDDQAANTTGEVAATFTAATDATTGLPQRRSILITPSGSSTGTITVTGTVYGTEFTETLTWAGETAAKETNICFDAVSAINVTSGLGAGVTVDVGTGTKFGVPYPMYGHTVFAACRDSAGTSFPGRDATGFAEGTDWSAEEGAPGTANKDPFGAISLGAGDTDPDGTANYAFYYIPSKFYDDDEDEFSLTAISY